MKRFLDFLKTCASGGLFVLLPLLLLYLLLDEVLGAVVALATPIADLFPAGTFDRVQAPVVVALALLLVASFVFGLALRSAMLSRVGRWIESNMLERLPMYKAVKALSRGFAEAGAADGFRTALLRPEGGTLELVYVVEEHADDLATILVPWSPAAFAGSVKIVPRERLEMLDATVGDASRVLAHWGAGMPQLLDSARRVSP